MWSWPNGRTDVHMYARMNGHLRPALLGLLCRRVDLNMKSGIVSSSWESTKHCTEKNTLLLGLWYQGNQETVAGTWQMWQQATRRFQLEWLILPRAADCSSSAHQHNYMVILTPWLDSLDLSNSEVSIFQQHQATSIRSHSKLVPGQPWHSSSVSDSHGCSQTLLYALSQ